MLTKTTIALAVAAALGAASTAVANEPTDSDGGGYRVQPWHGSQAWGTYNPYNAYGFASPNHKRGVFVAPPTQGRRLSREND
jgi:hypothetical protein